GRSLVEVGPELALLPRRLPLVLAPATRRGASPTRPTRQTRQTRSTRQTRLPRPGLGIGDPGGGARDEEDGQNGGDGYGGHQADAADEGTHHLLGDDLARDHVAEPPAAEGEDDEQGKSGTGVGQEEGVHGGRDVVAADPHRR